MTNGQSSRAIAASGIDRRIACAVRHPPAHRLPHPADKPRPQQTAPGRSRQTPAAADKPRPQQTNPGTQQGSTPAKNAACRTGLPLRRSAVAGACHCSNQPPPPSIVTQACHYSNRTSLKPAVAQAGRRSSRAPSRYPIAAPACCHPIRSLPRPAAARPLSTQKNAASPTGRGIPGCRHRLPYSHSIVAGGLEEMS